MNELYLTDAYGTKWMFYVNNSNHLCYTRGGIKDEILFKNITNEYDIAIDAYGHFHILLEDADGTLIYIRYNYNEWKKYEILKNKSSSPKISNIKLFMADKSPIAFYVLEHSGQKFLAEQKIREGVSTAPMIIDTLGKGEVLSIILDSEKCFHLLYKNELGKATYKTAPFGAKSFSVQEFLCEHDLVRTALLEDKSGYIHFAYIANINSYHTVCYYNTKDRLIKNLAFGVNPKVKISLACSDEKIYVRWLDGQRVYECVSANGGETFAKPANVQKGAKSFRVFEGNSSNLCLSETPLSSSKMNARTYQSPFSKSDETVKIKEKLRKTEEELKSIKEMYESLNKKVNHLTTKIDTETPIPSNPKPQQNEKYKYSDIKAKLESSDEDMTEVFNKLSFDDISFENAFLGNTPNLPAVIDSASVSDK